MGKLKNFFSKAKDITFKMLFPVGITCICCGGELDGLEKNNQLCQKCPLALNDNFCFRCGRAHGNMAKFCDRCINFGEYHFNKARSAVQYNDTARRLVTAFKYNQEKHLAEPLSIAMAECAQDNYIVADLITSVPLHPKRKRLRGYNQAELLAKKLSIKLETPCVSLLNKTVYTVNLAKLNRQERTETIKDSFEVADLSNIAEELYNNADSNTKNVLISYTNGINTYIKEHKNNLTVEFNASNFVPEN